MHLIGYIGKKSVAATIMKIISYYASFGGEESGNKNSGSSGHKSVCLYACINVCVCVCVCVCVYSF